MWQGLADTQQQNSFIEHSSHARLSVYLLSVAVASRKWQCRVVATESIRPSEPEIFTIWTFKG